MNHVTHPLHSADISIFHRKLANFAISKTTDIAYILVHNFYFFKIFVESLKVFFNKYGNRFDNVSKNDVIVFVHDVTKEILSRDSNYIVDLVMRTKFSKVIITSILQGVDQKNHFFEEGFSPSSIIWDWH